MKDRGQTDTRETECLTLEEEAVEETETDPLAGPLLEEVELLSSDIGLDKQYVIS
jgi:hypothetical protein